MGKTLYLLRHAKSSWDDASLPDHERPLAPRGERACKTMAKHLEAERIRPQVILCSSAKRNTQTLERIKSGFGGAPIDTRIESTLYAATWSQLLDRIRKLPNEVDDAMLIGHHPAIQDLALELAEPGTETERVRDKFPTAALATLRFDGVWPSLTRGGAGLVAFVKPRELKESA